MEKPKIKIIPQNEKDRKKAKILEGVLNKEWKRYGDIIEAISQAKLFILKVHGIDTGDGVWNTILKRIVEFDIKHKDLTKKGRTFMSKTQPQKIEDWEKEFDEEFLSNTRTSNEMIGFWWALKTNDPEEIKSFIRNLLKAQREQILGEEKIKCAKIILGTIRIENIAKGFLFMKDGTRHFFGAIIKRWKAKNTKS